MTMRAVMATEFGGPEVLAVRHDVDEPLVGPDSVLVRVRAASINPVDYKIVEGRLRGVFPTYLPLIPGWDLAGTVEAVGPAVTTVEPGQQVIGYARKDYVQHGTWAELVAVPQRCVVAAPDLDPDAGSCLPLAGLTAWQTVVDALHIQAEETILIHSASGGVGHLAVQIATSCGARVIGTASAANAEFVRSLGAEPVDHQGDVIDQVRGLAPDGVDAILDLHSADVLRASLPLLRDDPHRFATVTAADVAVEQGGHYVFVTADAEELTGLIRLAEAGDVVPTVSATYGLDDVADAVRKAAHGVRGKVVLQV